MNGFGDRFKVTVFGTSHTPLLGVDISGVPEGLEISEEDFKADLDRRRPFGAAGTARREEDRPALESGVRDGRTDGGIIRITFANSDTRPSDYSLFKSVPRPGHADYSAIAAARRKGTEPDLSGGGQFSGRMTLPVVAAGVIAKKMLKGISFDARLAEVGGSRVPEDWESLIAKAAAEGDSLGGVVECRISRVPAGVGEPFFDSIESVISHLVFSIPGVRGIEFGDGFAASAMRGSVHNDPLGPNGPLKNGSGGINGGLSNGAPIVFRVAFKPTSSIAASQCTWDFDRKYFTDLNVPGRHDVCFAVRTPVIVEAVAAIAMANLV